MRTALNITIWVTNDCNMKCIYCYEGTDKIKNYMSQEVAEATVNYINKLISAQDIKKCNIHFHGGEPLLNKNIIWYCIKQLNLNKVATIKYSLTTNATLLTDEIIKKLGSYIDELSVSLDGQELTHDLYRRDLNNNGTYKKVIGNSLLLLKNRPDISVRMTLKPNTVINLYDNITFLIRLGFKDIRFGIDYYDKSWNSEQMNILHKELRRIRHIIKDQKKKNIRVDMLSKTEFVKKNKCDGGISTIHIASNGELYPCIVVTGDKQFLCGDIYNGVSDEWLEKLNQINGLQIEECIGCTFNKCCVTTRCKIINKALTGSYIKPSGVICIRENIRYSLMNELNDGD